MIIRGKHNIDTYITKNKEYEVVSIYIGHVSNAIVTVRVLDDYGSPAIFKLENFEVIDGNIDVKWKFRSEGSGYSIEPEAIMYDGFWEDFFNDESDAVSTFLSVLCFSQQHGLCSLCSFCQINHQHQADNKDEPRKQNNEQGRVVVSALG